MAEIHNLKELNELGRELEINDYIYFTTKKEVIEYKVYKCISTGVFLHCIYHNNSYIFDCLELNPQDKYNLAERCYGYTAKNALELDSEIWPWTNWEDYQALEGLVREIYQMLGDNSVEVLNLKDLILNRFEILDL